MFIVVGRGMGLGLISRTLNSLRVGSLGARGVCDLSNEEKMAKMEEIRVQISKLNCREKQYRSLQEESAAAMKAPFLMGSIGGLGIYTLLNPLLDTNANLEIKLLFACTLFGTFRGFVEARHFRHEEIKYEGRIEDLVEQQAELKVEYIKLCRGLSSQSMHTTDWFIREIGTYPSKEEI